MSGIHPTNPTVDKEKSMAPANTSSDIGHDVKSTPKNFQSFLSWIWDAFRRCVHSFSSSLDKREVRQMYEMLDEGPLMAVESCKSVEKNLASENWDGVITDCNSIIANGAVFEILPPVDQAITYLNLATAHLNKKNYSDANACLKTVMEHEGFKKLSHDRQLEAHEMYLEALYGAKDYKTILEWRISPQCTLKPVTWPQIKSTREAKMGCIIALASYEKSKGHDTYYRSQGYMDLCVAGHYCGAITRHESWFKSLPPQLQKEICELKELVEQRTSQIF